MPTAVTAKLGEEHTCCCSLSLSLSLGLKLEIVTLIARVFHLKIQEDTPRCPSCARDIVRDAAAAVCGSLPPDLLLPHFYLTRQSLSRPCLCLCVCDAKEREREREIRLPASSSYFTFPLLHGRKKKCTVMLLMNTAAPVASSYYYRAEQEAGRLRE